MLPNEKNAVVESTKVRDDLLSAVHPVGRYKAAVFHALGYVADDWRAFVAVTWVRWLRCCPLRLSESNSWWLRAARRR
jgi:hypothetical protein